MEGIAERLLGDANLPADFLAGYVLDGLSEHIELALPGLVTFVTWLVRYRKLRAHVAAAPASVGSTPANTWIFEAKKKKLESCDFF
jgi:hypothetical protein